MSSILRDIKISTRGEEAGRHRKANICLEENEEMIFRNYVGKLSRKGRVHPDYR